MRWFWIDKFTEFESGRRAAAVKNVSLVEEHLDDYLPGFPYMASSLIVEGLAQTGGLLVAEHGAFRERVVLAKIGRAEFHRPAVPGDQLVYHVEIDDIQPEGAIVSCTSHVGDELQAEVELFFAQLGDQFDGDLFEPAGFLRMLRLFGLFEVGRKPDGSPIEIPAHLLEAEREDQTVRLVG